MIHTCEQFLNLHVGLGLDFVFVYLFMLNIICVVMIAYINLFLCCLLLLCWV